MNTHPSNRPLSLAGYIRKTVEKLKADPSSYRWGDANSCNCGQLAACILDGKGIVNDYSQDQVEDKTIFKDGLGGPWSYKGLACSITGMKISTVFRELLSQGLTPWDFIELENLASKAILAKMCYKDCFYSDGRFHVSHRSDISVLIPYLETWASMIEEFHQQQEPTEKYLEQVELRELVHFDPTVKTNHTTI